MSGNLLKPPLSPETVVFYITQDTQKHPLLPELISGLLRILPVFLFTNLLLASIGIYYPLTCLFMFV